MRRELREMELRMRQDFFVHAVFFATAFTSKTKTYLFLTVNYHINRKKQIKNCKYH